MIRSLLIERFRSFRRFELNRLGPINLLVGQNNSGKSSVLEAIDLLLAHGDPRSIWSALNRRGERLWDEEERRNTPEVDVCRLFNGYDLDLESHFRIKAQNDFRSQELRASIVETSESELRQPELILSDSDTAFGAFGLQMSWEDQSVHEELLPMPLTERGGLSMDVFRRRPIRRDELKQITSFVTTSSLTPDEVLSILSRIVLNPEEELLLKALRIIEPSIERIAPVALSSTRYGSMPQGSKGGVVVKCSGFDKRVPIGTMGDGIWRLLGIALALIRAEGGVLLIDEIDTGLHYSVMADMWRLVYATAVRLNVQVFATTHSSDCWTSLASVCESSGSLDDITVHRIEKGRDESIRLDRSEIMLAASRAYEIR